ncbi:Cytochrome c1 heme lyase [Mycoemilia scoparia]|uniref:Holocytochrome c-type synthase n=1 Tax=Mycoemilia scoparia TaxID=417184 RepID=A0A9W7ZZ10_9FUNG|nr:Cytochrome c1 heme lyase [Mycoemilia scoparia]
MSKHINKYNNMPTDLDKNSNTPPGSGGGGALSQDRTVSSIPRSQKYGQSGPSQCPAVEAHDDKPTSSKQTTPDEKEMKKGGGGSSSKGASTTGNQDYWVYPSEQMFYNAMKRKDWNPDSKDMKFVVPIHNAVNEMAWLKILDWEKRYSETCGNPKLTKFEGRSKDYTPKARFRSLVGYQLPFDRHDWTIDRCGKDVTYVIDFYEGKKIPPPSNSSPQTHNLPSFYLDVRPAITDFESLCDRVKHFFGF